MEVSTAASKREVEPQTACTSFASTSKIVCFTSPIASLRKAFFSTPHRVSDVVLRQVEGPAFILLEVEAFSVPELVACLIQESMTFLVQERAVLVLELAVV